MRNISAVVVIACLVGIAVIHAQSRPDRRVVCFSSNIARTVSLSQGGVTITTLSQPVGTSMAVVFDGPSPNLSGDRLRAHGSVSVRIVPDVQVRQPIGEAMLQAPVALSGENVDLIVERR
jgi:hypothetical protein